MLGVLPGLRSAGTVGQPYVAILEFMYTTTSCCPDAFRVQYDRVGNPDDVLKVVEVPQKEKTNISRLEVSGRTSEGLETGKAQGSQIQSDVNRVTVNWLAVCAPFFP